MRKTYISVTPGNEADFKLCKYVLFVSKCRNMKLIHFYLCYKYRLFMYTTGILNYLENAGVCLLLTFMKARLPFM